MSSTEGSGFTARKNDCPVIRQATMVFKVGGKMFALLAFRETPLKIAMKCDPGKAEALREMYAAVTPGYHLNKRHWNTVVLDGEIPDDEISAMTDASYALVWQSLPKTQRDAISVS